MSQRHCLSFLSSRTERTTDAGSVGRVTAAHLGMLLWALFVGLSFPAVGLLSEGLPPLLLTAMRFVIAALVLAPLAWRQSDGRPGLRTWLLYALMGLCLAGFFGTMFWVAHRVTALSMATLFVSVPLLAYGLGRGLGVERSAGRLLTILALGAAGALGLAWAENGGNFTGCSWGRASWRSFSVASPRRCIRCSANGAWPVVCCRRRRACGPSGACWPAPYSLR